MAGASLFRKSRLALNWSWSGNTELYQEDFCKTVQKRTAPIGDAFYHLGRDGETERYWTVWAGRAVSVEEWVKKLEDGRKVKFTYQELAENGAFITAQVGGNEVVYSVVLTKARNPLSREDVESHFKGELSKR